MKMPNRSPNVPLSRISSLSFLLRAHSHSRVADSLEALTAEFDKTEVRNTNPLQLRFCFSYMCLHVFQQKKTTGILCLLTELAGTGDPRAKNMPSAKDLPTAIKLLALNGKYCKYSSIVSYHALLCDTVQ